MVFFQRWGLTRLFNPLRAVRRARFGDSFSTTLAPFLNRLSLLGVTLGGLEMSLWDVAFRSQNWLWHPRCTMTPQHRNKTTLLHFGTPQIIKNWSEQFFKGVQKWFPKQANIHGAKQFDVSFIFYTLARSDVSEMDPILGAVWRPVLHKIRKNEEVEDTQK